MRYNYISIFILLCTGLLAQEELKYQDYWYRYQLDSTSNKISGFLSEPDNYQMMRLFNYNSRTHTIIGDSLHIKAMDWETGEVKYEQTLHFDISDNILVLTKGKYQEHYKPLLIDENLELQSISFSSSHGGWYGRGTSWTTIDLDGNVYHNYFDGYPDDMKTPSNLQVLLKTERKDAIFKISKTQIDALKTICKSTPIRQMKKNYGRTSDCDKNNAHLRIFHSEGVFVFDGMNPFEFLHPLYTWWRTIRKEIQEKSSSKSTK